MALKELKGSLHHKVWVASQGFSTDRHEFHDEVRSDRAGRLAAYMILALVVVVAFVMVTAPLWFNHS